MKNTPLHYAAGAGNTEVCEILVDAGALVNKKDLEGCTPLHYAAAGNFYDTINALVRLGADALMKNYDDKTPADLATDERVVELFNHIEIE